MNEADAPEDVGRDSAHPRLVMRWVRDFDLPDSEIPPEIFAATLSAFGPLPEDGQRDLAIRIKNARENYWFRKRLEGQNFLLPYKERNFLKQMGLSVRGILKLFGVEDPQAIAKGVDLSNLHPTATTHVLTGLYRVGVERRPARAAVSAQERLATLLTLMSDVVETAERCAHDIGTGTGHGGNRRKGKITPENELIEAIIEAYTELRDRFRKTGPQAAFDKSLKQFVRLVLGYVDPELGKPTRITDDAIYGAFKRWRAKSK